MRFGLALGAFLSLFLVSGAQAGSYNWSGIYLGAHGGYAWGDATTTDDVADWGNDPKYIGPFDYNADGAFGGGTVGFNLQHGSLVAGLEADVGYMNLDGSKQLASSKGDGSGDASTTYHQVTSVDGGWYADVTGRLGLAFSHVLVYGKGGYGWFDGERQQGSTKPYYTSTPTDSASGWVYGGGVEWLLGGNWSLKAEYLRFDFGTDDASQKKTSLAPGTDPDDGTNYGHVFESHHDLTVDTVKVGINYKFGERSEPAPLK